MYKQLLKDIDFKKIGKLEPSQRLETLGRRMREIVKRDKLIITEKEIMQLTQEIYEDCFEFGPISGLVQDPSVTEIMVNGHRQIYVEKDGRIQITSIGFRDLEHLKNIIDKILGPLGLRVDESEPMVDARLKDGSRINVVLSPISVAPMVVTIRKFNQNIMDIKDLMDLGMMEKRTADFLMQCVKNKMNMVVSGGTSTGKTTLLNVLSNFIPRTERLITIEDTLELKLNLPHVVRLESRPPNIEGSGAVSIRKLVKNALRMRPDRIIVGEIRGIEAIDVLQAMNTGHSGSLSTVHANSPEDVVSRLETLLLINNRNLTPDAVKRILASSLDLIIHLKKTKHKKIIQNISRLSLAGDRDRIQITDVCNHEKNCKPFESKERP